MATTSNIPVTGGAGYNVATTSISEDAVTKQVSRTVLNNSSGSEIGTASSLLQVGGTLTLGTSASVIGAVTQSGSWTTSVVGGVSVLGGSLNVGSVIGAFTPYAQPGSYVFGVGSVNGTNATSMLSAPAGGLRNYITTIKISNGGAVGAFVDIKDSGANTLDSGYAAASGGGWSTTFTVPLRQPTTAASVDVVPRTATSIIAAIVGYVAS